MPRDFSDDPAKLGELIEAGESAGGGGGSIGLQGTSIRDRLLNTSPDEPIDSIEGIRFSADAGKKYAIRGVRKFIGHGSTAAEDFALALVNGIVAFWREITGRNGGGGGGQAPATRETGGWG